MSKPGGSGFLIQFLFHVFIFMLLSVIVCYRKNGHRRKTETRREKGKGEERVSPPVPGPDDEEGLPPLFLFRSLGLGGGLLLLYSLPRLLTEGGPTPPPLHIRANRALLLLPPKSSRKNNPKHTLTLMHDIPDCGTFKGRCATVVRCRRASKRPTGCMPAPYHPPCAPQARSGETSGLD